jgi:hypothetical protein
LGDILLEEDLKIIDTAISQYHENSECFKAWLRIKIALDESTRSLTSTQSTQYIDCDKCGEIAEHHFCGGCLESYEH